MSLIDDETRAILKRYGISPAQYRKGKIDPATGTTTDSSGPVRSDQDRSGAQGPAIDVADMAAKFEEEVDNAIADLGADNENADLSPAEVLRQAKKIAMQNLKAWRKLPRRRDRREVELSGRIWPGGSYEAVAIYRKPDRGDSEGSGCRVAGQ